MTLSDIQDQAIQARMALIVGSNTFDRLFAGIRFDEIDGPILYVYARDEDSADEIQDKFAEHISVVASRILDQIVDVVLVVPKVLH
jgi:hypothetical protein